MNSKSKTSGALGLSGRHGAFCLAKSMFFKLDALFDNPGQPALNIFLAMELGQKDRPRGKIRRKS